MKDVVKRVPLDEKPQSFETAEINGLTSRGIKCL